MAVALDMKEIVDIRLPGALLSLALVVVACGGDSGAVTATTSAATATTTQAPATIEIRSFRFSGVQEVDVGTTVTVTNFDEFAHTWTADGGVFDSGSLQEGESFEFTFEESGEYSFFCSIHPTEMMGTITVTG